jgi:Uma2 family endonuclease
MNGHAEADVVLQPVLSSPRLAQYAARILDVLADEHSARRHFHETVTDGEKAEFINGEVIHHLPVRLEHNLIGKWLLKLLDTYVAVHRLGYVGYEKLLISLSRNDYEPDLCFFGREKADRFTARQMRFPAPDFIVEILSDRTAANDRGVKLLDYAAHGVDEYWIIDPDEQTIEQYLLRGDAYELAVKVKEGPLTSRAMPGFAIPARAIFDEAENVRALQALVGQAG